jgi:hypothetical protein
MDLLLSEVKLQREDNLTQYPTSPVAGFGILTMYSCIHDRHHEPEECSDFLDYHNSQVVYYPVILSPTVSIYFNGHLNM